MANFIDKARIKIISGKGGDGMVAWRREKYVDKGGPAGGDGGSGGSVYLIGDENLSTLMDFKHKYVFKAQSGENGANKNKHGQNGEDLVIKVPAGVIVRDLKSGKIIADIKEPGQKVLFAKGGRGGRGNARFATPQKRTPQFCEPGEPAIERDLELELKLMADVGLVGMPNAGKSTIISVVSAARPKIADYPFTTIIPNLGVVRNPYGEHFVMADIPGLIEGASGGVGLGFEFLKHVQRCKFLVHVVDISDVNSIENYKKINTELKKFDEELGKRYQVLVLNKKDLLDSDTLKERIKQFKKLNKDLFVISAPIRDGIEELLKRLGELNSKLEAPITNIDVDFDNGVFDNDDSSFVVTKLNKNTFFVESGKIKRLASVTDIRNTQQMRRFANILDAMGVYERLKEMGIKEDDTVIAEGIELVYIEKYF